MRLLPLLTLILTSSQVQAAVARESVIVQAARVQVLLRSLQDQPQISRDIALKLQPIVMTSQKQLAREQLSVVKKPIRLPSTDPMVLMIEGERFILPILEGQRSCEAIQEDWHALDRVYQEVSDLALELKEVYDHPEFCAPCADTVLTTLKQATEELEGVSTRLNADGSRQVMVVWGPEAFVQDREFMFMALSWDKLVYSNIDGDSHVGDATQPLPPLPGLSIRSPLLQNGIQFQIETTAERACSPGFEIRVDGLAKGMLPVERRSNFPDLARERVRSVPVKLILLSP